MTLFEVTAVFINTDTDETFNCPENAVPQKHILIRLSAQRYIDSDIASLLVNRQVPAWINKRERVSVRLLCPQESIKVKAL